MMIMMQSVFSDTAAPIWQSLIEEIRPTGKDLGEKPSMDDIQ